MKKEWADKWVAALRSGKYKQGKGALQEDGKFCCLGVLCDITNTPVLQVDGFGRVVYGSTYSYSSGYLPECVKEKTGMISVIAGLPVNLIVLNDRGATFEEIADTIENNWELL